MFLSPSLIALQLLPSSTVPVRLNPMGSFPVSTGELSKQAEGPLQEFGAMRAASLPTQALLPVHDVVELSPMISGQH